MLYTGIDLHKRTAVMATINERGTIVKEATVRTSRFDVASYFAQLHPADLIPKAHMVESRATRPA